MHLIDRRSSSVSSVSSSSTMSSDTISNNLNGWENYCDLTFFVNHMRATYTQRMAHTVHSTHARKLASIKLSLHSFIFFFLSNIEPLINFNRRLWPMMEKVDGFEHIRCIWSVDGRYGFFFVFLFDGSAGRGGGRWGGEGRWGEKQVMTFRFKHLRNLDKSL